MKKMEKPRFRPVDSGQWLAQQVAPKVAETVKQKGKRDKEK